MGRHEMNLKHVNSLKGTGTETDQDDNPYSSQPFLDYVYLMFEFMIALVLFCFITTNNFMTKKKHDPILRRSLKLTKPTHDRLNRR